MCKLVSNLTDACCRLFYLRFNHFATKCPRPILNMAHRNRQVRRGDRARMLLLSNQVAIHEQAGHLPVVRPGQVVEAR